MRENREKLWMEVESENIISKEKMEKENNEKKRENTKNNHTHKFKDKEQNRKQHIIVFRILFNSFSVFENPFQKNSTECILKIFPFMEI